MPLLRAGIVFVLSLFFGLGGIMGDVSAGETILSLPETVFRTPSVDTKYQAVAKILATNIRSVAPYLTRSEQESIRRSLLTIRVFFARMDRTKDTALSREYSARITGQSRSIARIVVNTRKRILSETDAIPTRDETFTSLGIILDHPIPRVVQQFRTLTFSGVQTDGKDATTLFLQSPSGRTTIYRKASSGSTFSQDVVFEERGVHILIIASGNGFESTNTVAFITVGDPIAVPSVSETDDRVGVEKPPLFERRTLLDLVVTNTIVFSDKNFHIVRLDQDGLRREFSGYGRLLVPLDAFDWWSKTRPITLTVLSSLSDTDTAFSVIYRDTGYLDMGYVPTRNMNITLDRQGSTLGIRTILPSDTSIDNTLLLLSPSGRIEWFDLDDTPIEKNHAVYARPWVILRKNIPLAETGTYLLEINADNGIAVVNVPIIYDNPQSRIFPLLPNVVDEWRDVDSDDTDRIRSVSVSFINALRTASRISSLTPSPTLDRIAQTKALDMARNTYVGHVDSYGTRIDGVIDRLGIDLTGEIGENVAGGDATYGYLLSALSLSAGHRESMIDPDFEYVGFGYVSFDGRQYYVQVFSHNNPD